MIDFKLIPHTLNFSFSARTSRGSMSDLSVIYIEAIHNDISGWGEICSLPGLSIDDQVDYLTEAPRYFEQLKSLELKSPAQILDDISEIIPSDRPSLTMAMETALLDLFNGGKRSVFPGAFSRGEVTIPINGLIWMGHSEDMLKQVNEKIYEGFDCIKIKIGGIDFDVECDILDYIRRRYYKSSIQLRLDANGSFTSDNALNRLHRLASFNIHSIEQPLKPGSAEMAELIRESPIPIALDEELIGISTRAEKEELLVKLKPAYLILKASLLGGFKSLTEWIELAGKHKIGWWVTSSLESNIGLNAISQYVSQFSLELHQGLGTGKLYDNNMKSPLKISRGFLQYDTTKSWVMNPGSDGEN